MKKLIPAVLFCFFLLSCGSRHWIAPAINGQVVDAKTGLQIMGVQIHRKPQNQDAEKVGESNHDGSFAIPAESDWKLNIPGGDLAYLGAYVFSKKGYQVRQVPYSVVTGDIYQRKAPEIVNIRIELIHQ